MAQVSIIRSTVLTNRDNFKPNDLRTAGRNFMKRGRALTVASDSADSHYGLFSVPANAVCVSALFSCDADGGTGTVDIGFWETPQYGGWSATTGWLTKAGGVATADQYFADALDISTALSKVEKVNNNLQTIAKSEQMIWQVLGLTADPQREYDLVVVCEAAITNAGNVVMELSYKLQ